MSEISNAEMALTFQYVNYRGETAIRRVSVLGIRWGSTA
jgi:hypothetical protein